MKNHAQMLRRAICFLTAVVFISICFPALGESAIYSWINSDVEGNAGLLTPARLKDDFHLAVNKQWLLLTKVPHGGTEASAFAEQSSLVMERKMELMLDDTLTGPDAALVRTLYELTMDWDTRNALGMEPLRPYVEDIENIQTLADLAYYLTTDLNVFELDPSSYDVIADLKNPDRYVAILEPVPLILGDSAEYTARTDYGDMLYEIASRSTLLMLKNLGYAEETAQAVFNGAMAFDEKLARSIQPYADHYASDYLQSILHYYSREELSALCGDYPIMGILNLTAIGQSETFLVTEPEFFRAVGEMYTEENVALFRNWLLYFLVNYAGRMLDRDTYDALEAIEAEVFGVQGLPGDIDIAYRTLTAFLPVPMDNLYIQNCCTVEEKQEILNIADEVIGHYRSMLLNEVWLSPQTREKAVEKLEKLHVNAVYPDELGDWSDLRIRSREEGGTLMEALITLYHFSTDLICDRVNQPVIRGRWNQLYAPASVANASYSITENTMTIFAGILGGVFYDPDMTYEEKLGGIGMVIAHEISHAFDDDGANYDAEGCLNNWWEPEDYAAFRARAGKLSAYYDGYEPYPGGTYSGMQVQGEAIADMTSMKCMLAIASTREGFDYNAFFRQFASVWRTKMLRSALTVTLATDPHPLGCLRTNVTVQQFEEFYNTYDIRPGDGMYLAPEDRIAVW
ncbi:MAG: M13 family metallopeptidase [Clostridia bacterium]|nr:M13 family metallopeptidase [Clostridia bacterium]